MRKAMLLLTASGLVTLVVGLGSWTAYGGGKKPVPPGSTAYGKTLTEWMLTYWRWAWGGEERARWAT